MTVEKERKLFESWAVSEGNIDKKRLLSRQTKGMNYEYMDREVQIMWVSWHARGTLFIALLQELRYA
jgi:hypothetical protein